MKIGMPALVEMNNIEENVKLCRKLNLEFVELNMDLPYCFPENTDLRAVKDKYNIEFTIHLSEKIEIGEIYEPMRESNILYIKDIINWGKNTADIVKYNLHLDQGVHFSLPDKKIYIFEKYNNQYRQAIEKSLQELSEFAVNNKVFIYFENTKSNDYILESFDKIKNYDNLGITLDVGHNLKNKGIVEEHFIKSGYIINHMHIHDCINGKDHNTLGTGDIDIMKYANMCKENNIDFVVEVKREEELVRSINYLKENNFF